MMRSRQVSELGPITELGTGLQCINIRSEKETINEGTKYSFSAKTNCLSIVTKIIQGLLI